MTVASRGQVRCLSRRRLYRWAMPPSSVPKCRIAPAERAFDEDATDRPGGAVAPIRRPALFA